MDNNVVETLYAKGFYLGRNLEIEHTEYIVENITSEMYRNWDGDPIYVELYKTNKDHVIYIERNEGEEDECIILDRAVVYKDCRPVISKANCNKRQIVPERT